MMVVDPLDMESACDVVGHWQGLSGLVACVVHVSIEILQPLAVDGACPD